MAKRNKTEGMLGDQSRWEIIKYLLLIGDYRAAVAWLFVRRRKPAKAPRHGS
jgi:hypothetical protein